jgi:predicted aminopeptidase
MRAAYEQSKILIARRDIQSVIQDSESSQEERDKLQVVVDARAYAISIGLKPGNSFTQYAKLDKDTLAWVLLAARKDAFSLHTWWFPIVGRVPYKGYFDKEDADEAAKELEQEGYESWVRGTDAFSTLGWFNDPVLSTTLRGVSARIANTVIHESVHSTVWIKNNVSFNESLANFVGSEGAVQFFRHVVESCKSEQQCQDARKELATAEADRDYQYEFGGLIDNLYAALSELYTSSTFTSEQKIAKRAEVFAAFVDPFREKSPRLRALQTINNAEIMQMKLYLSELMLFKRLYDKVGGSWSVFMDEARAIATQIDDDDTQEAFALLKNKLDGGV